jgi:hypothetical protein
MQKFVYLVLVFSTGMAFATASVFSQAIVIDHTCTDLSRIPESYISLAKADLRVGYSHTSSFI